MLPGIELFRGIASLMVLTDHYAFFFTQQQTLLHYLGTGVDCFFMMSGFVFGHIIYGKTAVEVFPYLVKRFFRIYPLYFCSLVAYYIFSRSDPNKLLYFFKHLLFLQTTSQEVVSFFNGAYWILPVEMEFYLLVPLLALLARKLRHLLPAVFAIAIALRLSLSMKATMPPDFNAYSLMIYHLPGILTEFAVGLLLFRIYERRKGLPPGIPGIAVSFFLGAVVFSLVLLFLLKTGYRETNTILLRFTHPLFPVAVATGYALILFPLLFIIRSGTVLSSFCLFFGSISYALYLFHTLSPGLLRKYQLLPESGPGGFLLSAVVTVAISIVCHYLVEKPLRALGNRLAQKLSLHGTSPRSSGC